MLMRLMSKGEYLIVPKGTKFKGSGKLGLIYEGSYVISINQVWFQLYFIYSNETMQFYIFNLSENLTSDDL